jgi:chromosome segregation ATPase
VDIARINVNGDFEGDDDRNIDDIIRDGEKLKKQGLDAKRLAKDMKDLEGQAFADAMAHNAETIKSNEKVKKSNQDLANQRAKEIAAKERLTQLEKEYGKVQDERGKKSSIRSKRDAEFVKQEIALLREIRDIQEQLGIVDARKARRLEVLEASFEKFIQRAKEAYKTEEAGAAAVEKAEKAIRKKAKATEDATKQTEDLSDAVDQLTLNLEAQAEATDKLNSAREKLSNDDDARAAKSRNRGGGGGGTIPPTARGGAGGGAGGGGRPPGGLPDEEDFNFDFEAYLKKIQERINQTIVELSTAEGRKLRFYQDELRILADREKFARRAIDLEGARAQALGQVEELRLRIREEGLDASAIRRLKNEIDSLTRKINEADEALKNQRGNADGLRDGLRRATFQSQQLVDRTREDLELRRAAIVQQRELIDQTIAYANERAQALRASQAEYNSTVARLEVEREIRRIGESTRALGIQRAREAVLTQRELERVSQLSEDLQIRSEEVLQRSFAIEATYALSRKDALDDLTVRLQALKEARDIVSDPAAIKTLSTEIARVEDQLDEVNRRYASGRANIEAINEAVQRTIARSSRVLSVVREQNTAYEEQRQLAEATTRGLRQDIRSQRLRLDNLLAETASLEAQRQIRKAIADLDDAERRRQRDVRRGDFSEAQANRLLEEAGEAILNATRAREQAVKTEREYNLEISRQKVLIVEIQRLLSDRDPLFKGGFSTTEIDKFEVALEKLRRELEDTADAGGSLDGVNRRLRRFRDDLEQSRVPLNRFELALTRLRDRLGFLGRAFSALDSQSRGFSLFTSLATVIIEPLAAVVVQLAGGLLAVASSAVAAGGALGGALVAGVAQAIPAITLLAAGFKSLIDVVQISNRQRQDEASNLAREARGVGGAADGVNRLKDANDNLVEAQRRLSDARRQAIRDLEDLADKERQAELASRSASISVIEAQIALDQARSTGSALDIRRAEIELAGARISERQAERDVGRTRFDAATQRREGVENNDQVIAAKRALASAERQLADARVGGASAASALSQATARLDEQIKMLSPGQRELLDGINELRKVFRSGPFVEIRDIILQPFIAATDALIGLGQDSALVGSFKALATSISETLGGAINSLFSPRARDFIFFINGQASGNVRILGEGFASLGSIIEKISVAAAPVLRDLLIGIVDTFDRIDDSLTESGLKGFFDTSQDALNAFGQVVEETFLLLKNLFELSAPTGNTLVSTFATFLRGINQQLSDPSRRREIRRWFEEVGRGTAAFASALKDLTVAIFGGLNPDRLRQFSVVISDILAPAIRTLIDFSGKLVSVFALLERVPLASELTALAIATVVLGKTFTTILGIVGLLQTAVFGLASALGTLSTVSRGTAAANAMGGLSAVLVGANGQMTQTTSGALKAQGALGGLGRAAGPMRVLGQAVSRLGPYGLAAGIGLTLFGDALFQLIPGLETVEDKANRAREALLALDEAASQNADAALDLQEAEASRRRADNTLDEARAARQQAALRLRNAENKQEREAARRDLESARISVIEARNGVDRADKRLRDAQNRARQVQSESDRAAAAAAKTLREAFDAGPNVQLQGRNEETGLPIRQILTPDQRLKNLKQLVGDDEDFKALDEYTQAKYIAILENILDQKGKIPEERLELVFKAVADNKSISDILALLDIKIPKGLNVDVLFDQERIAAEATAAGKSIEELFLMKIDRINAVVAAVELNEASPGRPAPARAFADGGIVRASPGGVVIKAAEDGYDEFVITTDPTKKEKSKNLLRRAARAVLAGNNENDQYGISEGDPPSLRGRGRRGGGSAGPAARNPLAAFFTMFNTAERLDAADIPYSWGGGHTTPARPTPGIKSDGKDGSNIVGLDCSSSVSAVLQSAIPSFPTITSGEFPGQSALSPGRGLVTIWSNNKHVFMTFGAEDWGTNSGEPGNGPGFHDHSKGGYTPSHPDFLGPGTRDQSLFGRVYKSLRGADYSAINNVQGEFESLGRTARNFNQEFGAVAGDGGGFFNSAARSILSNAFKNFQQFQYGGEVQGRRGQAVPVIAHAGEYVLTEEETRRARSGQQSRTLVDSFVKTIEKAFEDAKPIVATAFKRLFQSVGIGLERDGRQTGVRSLIPNLDLRPGKPGGGVNILTAVSQFIQGGYDAETDKQASLVLNTSPKKFGEALKKVSDKVAGYLESILSAAQNRIAEAQRSNQGLADRLQTDQLSNSGSFDQGSGLFRFVGGFAQQQGDSAADIALERESLIGQRSNLIAARNAIQGLISQTATTIAGLEGKLNSLRAARARLVTEKNQVKGQSPAKKRERARIQRLIDAVDAEIKSVEDQIQAAKATQQQLESDLTGTNAQITQTESQIADTQGRQIDALIAQATSGRYSAETAKGFFDQAEQLAIASNDQQRLAAIRAARFNFGQSQFGGLIGEQQARVRLAEATGNEAERRAGLQEIGRLLAEQAEAVRGEIARLEAEGVDLNSPELINLRTTLTNLNLAIKDNTDALNGTTTQNFSSTAWQLFRRAIFGGENQLLQGFSGVGGIDNATRSITTPAVSPDMVYIMPAGGPGSSTNSNTSTTNITVNVSEAEPGMDPTYLAGALAFALDGKP